MAPLIQSAGRNTALTVFTDWPSARSHARTRFRI